MSFYALKLERKLEHARAKLTDASAAISTLHEEAENAARDMDALRHERDEAIKHEREALEVGGKVADALNDELDRTAPRYNYVATGGHVYQNVDDIKPRPLTPEDIDIAMVRRALDTYFDRRAGENPGEWMGRVLIAALTPEPKRPEWEDAPYVWADSTQGKGRVIWKRAISDDGRVSWSAGGTWHPSWMLSNVAPVAPEGDGS